MLFRDAYWTILRGRPPMLSSLSFHLRATLAALVLATPLALRAQATLDSAIVVAGGSFFALSVPDLDASVRWYVEKLGLRRVTSFPAQGGVTGALLAGGGLEVELLSHTGAATVGNPMDASAKVLTRGIMKVGFRVADFDRAVATLKARGAEIVFGPFPPRRDQRANVLIRDNSGNLIQLFGDFAR